MASTKLLEGLEVQRPMKLDKRPLGLITNPFFF